MMTQKQNRTTEPFDSHRGFERRLDSHFWHALLVIRNHYFDDELQHYVQNGRPRNHIIQALQTLDCWLEEAVHAGCLETEESNK